MDQSPEANDLINCDCYQTKLGSAHLGAIKSIYWHKVVVKKSTAFALRPSKFSRLVFKRTVFGRCGGEGCGVHGQLMDILLTGWW